MPQQAHSFVLIGPMFVERAPAGFNITDDLGGPKELKRFFRWNNPYLTYTFDQSFVRYFGLEGMEAIHDAFRVVNDFFIPADGSYKGVSSMDFARDGYLSNYNTTWVNTTAQNDQIIDIKSLALGMLVNQLGVGNPHRYAFTVRGISTNTTGTQWSFDVRLLNFDPQTWQPTDVINGVQYSYRLIHDAPPQAGGAITAPTFVDMEEFTTDTSGNAWTSVAGIADAFYGSTAIYWTDTPTAFNFGVYYDGRNAMGGQYQPRHALTYDDAGALKYLYRTNNFVYEDLELAINLVEPPQFLPKPDRKHFLQSNMPQGRGVIPRRSGGNVPPLQPAFATTHPLRGVPIIGFPGQLSQMVGPALRGGIDRMQFYYQPLDSLLGTLFTPTNFIWTDTFVTTNGNNVQGLGVTTPGSSAWIGQPNLSYYSQKVGRTVTAPDIIFVCDDLGQAPDGVPVAWHRTGHVQGSNITEGWTNNGAWANVGLVALNTTNTVGPGNIFVPPNGIIYTFARMGEGFEVVWSGETSVVGNQTQPFSLWGHIRGPGPLDVTVFPRDTTMWRLENEISPKTAPPIITMISDNGGLNPIATNSFTRTQETISIIGSGMASVTAIEVLSGDKVVQTIFQADKFKVSGQRIDIPPGVLDEQAEGSARTIRVWNTVGASEKSPQQFNIYTGRAVVIGTSMDGRTFDRAQPLTVYGYGFKSLKTRTADGNASLTYVRLEDGLGNLVVPQSGNAAAAKWEVVSDTQAVLPVSTFNYQADGSLRRIRVSRGSSSGDISPTLSSTNNVQLINWITTKPTITGLESIDLNGTRSDIGPSFALRRDRAIDINGTALNTALAIEVVKQDGTSFTNPVVINLPNAGVTVDDNGSRIQVSANVIPYNDADGHAADQRYKFKVYNRIGNDIRNVAFNVNVQPSALSVAGFTLAHAFNRHHVTGDNITLTGTGLKAISEIRMVYNDGTWVDVNGSSLPSIVLPHPGVTVKDASIFIDTSVAQFGNAEGNTDSNSTTDWRRFRLISARDNVLTPAEHRFYVGLTPTYESLAGLTPGSLHYRRDSDTMNFMGKNLGIISRVEIVDINGNPIPGVGSINTSSGVTKNIDGNFTNFTVSVNAFSQTHLLDSVKMDKRVRVHTPFGTATSAADGAGMFTVSATSVVSGIAGTGYDVASNTYNAKNGNLILYGKNFRGVSRLLFYDNSGTGHMNLAIDPQNPPQGVSINALGTQISFSPQFFEKSYDSNATADTNGSWLQSDSNASRLIRFTSAAGESNSTTAMKTRDLKGFNASSVPIITQHPDANHVWVTAIEATDASAGIMGIHWGGQMWVDGNSSVYTSGYFVGTVSAGGNSYTATTGNYDGFLAKFGTDGSFKWFKSMGATGGSSARVYPRFMTGDSNGNTYLTGLFRDGAVDFGGTTLTSGSSGWPFVVKFSSSGNLQWAKKISAAASNYTFQNFGIKTDSSSNVYVVGGADLAKSDGNSTLDFSGNSFVLPGANYEGWLWKLDTSGNHQWVKSSSTGAGDTYARDLAVDNSDNIIIDGFFRGSTASVGSVSLSNLSTDTGDSDAYIAKLNSAGTVQWATRVGSSENDFLGKIATDTSGNIYTTMDSLGGANRTYTFGGTTVEVAGGSGSKLLIGKMNGSGNAQWVKQVDPNINARAHEGSIAVHTDGTFTIAGLSRGPWSVAGFTQPDSSKYPQYTIGYNSSGVAQWATGTNPLLNHRFQGMDMDGAGNVYSTGHFRSSFQFGSETYVPTYSANNRPHIYITKYQKTPKVGDTISIVAKASGEGTLTYQWQKDGVNVGPNSSTYTIANIQPSHAGTYKLTVSNSNGSVTSNTTTITVNP